MELTGKTALVTGATNGIGRDTAKLLAAEGAEVIITGRDAERGDAVAKAIAESGGSARFVAAELTEVEAIRGLVKAVGAVDILVNNAAIVTMGSTVPLPNTMFGASSPDPFDTATFDSAFAANVRAPFILTAAFAPAMVAKGSGSIVNITTIAARVGMPGLPVYSATKGALESLTRTWAAELSPSGVRVNAIAPGPVGTDVVMETLGEEGAAQMGAMTLLGRVATPREIAEIILFLASDRSTYFTGSTVVADGGLTTV
jgi:NAD(P)-dependent dehydrogenase (short-subunit alcohol dehydrogenase family)